MSAEADALKRAYERIAAAPSLCGALRAALDDGPAVRAACERAERERQGYFVLPGTGGEPFFVGAPPRWKDNPVGDEEFVWMLNRHVEWKDYLIAYCVQGRDEFLGQIRTELFDWVRACPRPALTDDPAQARLVFSNPDRASAWRSLETGIRMYDAWNYAVPALIQEGRMTAEEFAQAAASVRDHAELLYRVAPLIWPNADHNHYMMENLGLISAAQMLRELPEAGRWAAHASRELARCVRAQVTPAGGHVEGSPAYHALCMALLCKWVLASRAAGGTVDAECLDRIRLGMNYALSCTRPTGVTVPYGDSDPAEDAVLPAALAVAALGESGWLTRLRHLMGDARVREVCRKYPFDLCTVNWDVRAGEDEALRVPETMFQPQLGQAMFRSDWTEHAFSVFFGCRIPCYNGHSHIDPASFDFCALGRALVVDPGRYTYRECPSGGASSRPRCTARSRSTARTRMPTRRAGRSWAKRTVRCAACMPCPAACGPMRYRPRTSRPFTRGCCSSRRTGSCSCGTA